ncbi:hypothetical protein D5086_030855 [Populus alba]|uniref:Uncharacterized protein n=1 Tax=Populus alba TaxID=43335 RepID=A0ACC4AQB2_POPAL
MANGESPYKRTTYRYSPLLAFLLTPNSFIHRSWGKFIFSACRFICGSFIQYILKKREVPEDMCLYSVMLTRRFFTQLLFFRSEGNIVQAAFWYGLVVHFRIYPIIYALPIVLVLDPHSFQSGQKPCLVNWKSSQDNASHGRKEVSEVYGVLTALKTIFTRGRIMFAMVSGSVFMLCTGLFFYLYRWEFLNEALLYHLTRTDPRHNFSIYFYHIYLHVEHEFSVVEKLISFLPQLIVQLVLIIRFCSRPSVLPFLADSGFCGIQ